MLLYGPRLGQEIGDQLPIANPRASATNAHPVTFGMIVTPITAKKKNRVAMMKKPRPTIERSLKARLSTLYLDLGCRESRGAAQGGTAASGPRPR
jgi:hypothetical protein